MMLSVNTKPRRKNAPRIAEKSAPGFLQWLRSRPCVFAIIDPNGCEGKIEAMHLDFAGGKGVGSKVADMFSVPSCTGHHRRQHNKGWRTFSAALEISFADLLKAAETFWRAWPGRIAWERKQEAQR